jgi:epoxyqueuosine reductase
MRASSLAPEDTRWVCERSQSLGFALCGVAPAERFPELARYSEWLDRGYAGEMKYLHDPRRLDPRMAVPEARSLIVCALNYNSPGPYSTVSDAESTDLGGAPPRGWISRYAWGDDYHGVLWAKLNALVAELRAYFPGPFEARAYADTGPIHERAAAKYAGLGWLGKNTLLINQQAGSWLFLGAIVTTLPLLPTLGPDELPPADRCGSCRACLEACPTQAIVEPYVLDASRCIAYLTIELRGSLPEQLRAAMGRHVFGCDICQDVCPWNRKSPRTDAKEFQPRIFARTGQSHSGNSFFQPDLLQLASLSEAQFREWFQGSPIKRTKWRGLVRNACIALGNAGLRPDRGAYREVLGALEKLSASEDSVISESARWAISRIEREGHRICGSEPL